MKTGSQISEAAAAAFRRLPKAATAAAIILAAAIGVPGKAHALKRLSSQFIQLSGEAKTNALPADNATGGKAFYAVTVSAEGSDNVLYVSVSGTGDLAKVNNGLLLACLVDGIPCNRSRPYNNSGKSGWTGVQTLAAAAVPDDSSDQNFHYTWCVPITPRPSTTPPHSHSVQLRFASKDETTNAFIEQIYVNIDSEKIQNSSLACTQGTPPPS
jgi:hypothetical protein